MNFALICEFWCFSLGKQARFTLNFCSGMPLRKVHELSFLWFGLPGPLLIKIPGKSDFCVGSLCQDFACMSSLYQPEVPFKAFSVTMFLTAKEADSTTSETSSVHKLGSLRRKCPLIFPSVPSGSTVSHLSHPLAHMFLSAMPCKPSILEKDSNSRLQLQVLRWPKHFSKNGCFVSAFSTQIHALTRLLVWTPLQVLVVKKVLELCLRFAFENAAAKL